MDKENSPPQSVQPAYVRRIFIIALIIWAIASILPTYTKTTTPGDSYPGFMAFLWGPVSFLASPWLFIAWTSNLFALISFKLFKKGNLRFNLLLGILAVIVAPLALLVHSLPFEGANRYDVTIGIGVYVWMASIATFGLANVLATVNTTRQKSTSSTI